jgi:hypothetical protein
MQFYPEPLVPLRVPTPEERLDPPLVDIYVPDGRRTGDKVNVREAQVIIARIEALDRWRSIGVISLIGAKQDATINSHASRRAWRGNHASDGLRKAGLAK